MSEDHIEVSADESVSTKSRTPVGYGGFWNWFFGLFGVFGTIFGIFTYFTSREVRELTFGINPTRSTLVAKGQSSYLSVQYAGKRVEGDVHAVQIAIWNNGKRPIESSDILKPVVLKVPTSAKLLEGRVRKASREEIQFRIDDSRLKEGFVGIDWRVLEYNDGGVIQIILEGDKNVPITLDGTIKGQRVIEPLALRSDLLRMNSREMAFLFLVVAGCWVLNIIMLVGEYRSLVKYSARTGVKEIFRGTVFNLALVILTTFALVSLILGHNLPPFEF